MARPRESRDDILFRQLVDWKRHIRSCRQCSTAKRVKDTSTICATGYDILGGIAFRLDDLIELRRRAFTGKDKYITACPDPSKHGRAYALVALPMAVTGIQDGLF